MQFAAAATRNHQRCPGSARRGSAPQSGLPRATGESAAAFAQQMRRSLPARAANDVVDAPTDLVRSRTTTASSVTSEREVWMVTAVGVHGGDDLIYR